jgi:hypothetical protein
MTARKLAKRERRLLREGASEKMDEEIEKLLHDLVHRYVTSEHRRDHANAMDLHESRSVAIRAADQHRLVQREGSMRHAGVPAIRL